MELPLIFFTKRLVALKVMSIISRLVQTDYRTGLPGPGPGGHELRGPLSQSLCMKSMLCISYLWLKKVYFVNLLMAFIECTCAVLENVHVCQGRNYRQCSLRRRFVGKADPAFLLF